MIDRDLSKLFAQTGTIKGTWLALKEQGINISQSMVRRDLLNAGLIPPSHSMRKAREMYARGIPPSEIATTLRLNVKAVKNNLPRQKNAAARWTQAEDEAILCGAKELPNRTLQAIRNRLIRLGFHPKRSKRRRKKGGKSCNTKT